MSKLANEFPTIVDDLGGSIERRFLAPLPSLRALREQRQFSKVKRSFTGHV